MTRRLPFPRLLALTTLALASLAAPDADAAVTLHRTPGFLRDIDIGADGSIYAIGGRDDAPGNNGWVYRWRGKNWERFTGSGTRITVDRDGNPWVVNSANEIWRYRAGAWSKLPGAAIDIDAGAGGQVYLLGTDEPAPGNGTVYRFDGSGWTRIGGYGKRITVDRDGNPWLVNGGGEVWRRTSGEWARLPGRGAGIDAGADGSVWLVGDGSASVGRRLFRWVDDAWRDEGGSGNVITTANDGKPAVINQSDELWSGYFDGVRASRFGAAAMRSVDGKPATGTRPVLTLMVEYSDIRFRAPHDTRYFEDLLFDRPRSVAAYFRNASAGSMSLTQGPIVRVRLPDTFECAHRWESCATRSGTNFVQAYADAVMHPSMNVDFSTFDTDRNERITDDELMVVVVTAMDRPSLWSGGVNRRWPDDGCTRTRTDGIELCSTPALVAEGTGFATIAHELSHTLSTHDVYGARARQNPGMTLMAGTEIAAEDVHRLMALDPWHRMRLGWTDPRIVLAAPGGKTIRMRLALPQADASANARPLLVFDPRRDDGTHIEYFMLEFRNPGAAGATDFDAHGGDRGVVVWSVRQRRDNHNLTEPPSLVEAGNNGRLDSTPIGDDELTIDGKGIKAGPDRILQSRPAGGSDDVFGRDKMLLTIAPGDQSPGLPRAWRSDAGTQTLRWLSDNTASPIRLRVLPFADDATSVEVEISFTQ